MSDYNHWAKLAREFGVAHHEIIRESAERIRTAARDSMGGASPAPPGSPPAVRTGELRDSIEVIEIDTYQYLVSTSVPHGTDLEYGTRKMAARPWLTPAVEAEQEKFESAFSNIEDKLR